MRFSFIVAMLAAVALSHACEAQQPDVAGLQKTATVGPRDKSEEVSAVQRYTPEDVVGVVAIQPSRMLKSKYLQMMVEAASGQQEMDTLLATLTSELGMDPRTVQEMAILFDRETIDRTLSPMGEPAGGTVGLKNNLKQFGLAMHNMHNTYGQFPDDDGIDNEHKGNLSWRVWMLPYLEQVNLFNQFHQDEPWDSEHNKTLIEKMPAIFESPGVTEKGKTSVHVFTGEGAPFAGDEGPGIQNITDGTSNTIMLVLAGADKADVWTKPGGLDFDPKDPVKALGKIDKQFLVGFMDGSVRSLAADINPVSLTSLITQAGGEVVDAGLDGSPARVQSMPGIILQTTAPMNRDAIFSVSLVGLGEGTAGKIGSQDVTVFESCMVAMPDDRTLLVGPEPLLKKMLAPRAAADGQNADTVQQQLYASFPTNDIVGMIELESLKDLKAQMAQNTLMPGLFEGLQGAMFTADLAGTGEFLSQIEVRTTTKNSAMQLSALAEGMLQMQKAQMLSLADTPESPLNAETAETLAELYDTVKITTKDSSVSYVMPKPDSMDSFFETMKPGIVAMFEAVRESRKAATAMSRMNNMKQIGLAFHNYHDTFNHFPAANGDGVFGEAKKTGLSWRVHLLPFIEQLALYQQFNFDEAWDSPHNKALIEQMPDIFKVEGVDKPGYTSIHVFTGDNTGMGSDDGTSMRDFTDGTSNTILAVVAGPESAEVWTKPGGLEFNADDPKKVLGTLGEQFLVLISDGSVRFLKSSTDDETFGNFIQRNDGNPVNIE